MAQSDANEQVKEILRQLIKHRFWIAIGFATLFAVVAYFMGSGPVKAKAQTEIANIKKAEDGVKAYQTPTKPTDSYKPIVLEKTEIMDKDVNKAWKELYDRQAPLLTWPDIVKDRIGKWGPKWPENQDPGKVALAIVDYIEAYPAYVDMVYKTFDPFDYETGKGIVAAPPKEALLQPAQFSIDGSKLPTLGKIWWAQERLWMQRTMLEVVHQVNQKAKDWDSAIIKEITVLEVGSQGAQDQKSQAKGEELSKAEDILSPEQEAAAAESGADGAGGGGAMGAGGPMGGGSREMMSKMMGGGRGGAGGMTAKADDGIYFLDKGQCKIYPVMITVLIDQDRVQDLLVELENSPMSIQVKDIELERPSAQVTKPEKGEGPAGMGMMGAGMGGMMRMRGMMGGRGFGGMSSMRDQMMMQMGQMGGMGRGDRGMGGPMGMGRMGGMMPGIGGAANERKKVDVRNRDAKAERTKKLEELEKRKGPSLFDPYFNIVQVTVYGQARFYNAPPAEPEAQPSPGEAGVSPGAAGAPGENSPAAAAPNGGTPAVPAADEKGKPAAPAPDAKTAAPSASGDAKAAPGPTNVPEKPDSPSPANAKPAAPGAEPAKPGNPGATTKK